MKKKIIVLTIIGALAFVIILIVFASSIMPAFPSDYGVAKISVNGKQLYFIRETRGLNYDSVVLSANGDYCAEYNPESDYRFITMDPAIYYKIDSDTLYLLSGNPTLPGYEYKPEPSIAAPESFPVKVVIVKPGKLIVWEKRKEIYQDRGMELLEIPISNNLKCYLK